MTPHRHTQHATYIAAAGVHSGLVDAHCLSERRDSLSILPRIEVEGPEVVESGGIPVDGKGPAGDCKNHPSVA